MAAIRVYIEEKIFEKLTSVSDLGKEAALNDAVNTYLSARELAGKEYPSAPDDAIESIIRHYLTVKKSVLREIKGIFTKPEIVGMIDAFNGTMIGNIPIPAKDMLSAQMEDSETYDFSSTRHGYEITALLSKIDNLTTAEAEFWLQELVRFWEELSSQPDSLDKFIENYV